MDEFKYFLEKKGFYYKKTDKLPRLKALTKRYCRGHQSYDACSVKDLKTLLRNRGLNWQDPNKKYLVQCLEAADDAGGARNVMMATKKFHRFSELPPELRNRVYVLYFESLVEVPPRFVLPPLCRASRQLRSETTEPFFQHSTFIVWLKDVFIPRDQQLPTHFLAEPRRFSMQLHYHTEVARRNIPN